MQSIEVRPIGGGDPLSEPSLARELAQNYLIWDAFVAGQRRVDVHPLVLSPELHRSAVRAAEGVVRAIGAVAERAHVDERERAAYRLKPDTLKLVMASHAGHDDAAWVRVDLLLDMAGEWRACEINADCPGGHNESLALPKLARAAGFMGACNPTRAIESLVERIIALADGGAVALLYATAYSEDLQVCALVQRMLQERGVEAILAAPTAPRLKGDQVFVGKRPVKVLYRYFPTEWMEGQRNVTGIAEALRRGWVKCVTAFSHVYSQSKLGFARAWFHKHALDRESREIVSRHIPYSVDVADVPRDALVRQRKDWVLKRAFGRVGDQVHVGATYAQDDWVPLVDDVLGLRASGESWLAQRFVPQRTVSTPWGDRYLTLGAYVVEGRFCGYYARITPQSHVSHDALCVPVFYDPTLAPNVHGREAA